MDLVAILSTDFLPYVGTYLSAHTNLGAHKSLESLARSYMSAHTSLEALTSLQTSLGAQANAHTNEQSSL